MGSTKYPNENEYDDYLTKHGGSSNAFTELTACINHCSISSEPGADHDSCGQFLHLPLPQETTNYHFDVSPKNLRGALDRFAQVRQTIIAEHFGA
eukprot:233677-Pelagomonas_calceolata.AAC.10